MADPIGATISLDISDVKKSLTEANRLIKENEANWRVNASAMGDWTRSEQGLTDRMRFLSKTIEQQEKNVEGLAQAREEAIKKYGAESKEVQDLNSKIITHSKNLERSRKEYAGVEKALDGMTKANADSNDEIEETGKESKKASKEVQNLEKSADEAGKGFSVFKGVLANVIAGGIMALASSAKEAVSSLLNLTESTAEYRKEMGMLTTVAEQVGVSGDRIIDKWIDVNSVINDEGAVTEGINNLLTAGFTAEQEMDAITRALEGASIKWKDTLKFEGLADSLQEWIGSGGESLSGSFAELLERLGYNLEEVTEQTKGMTDAQRRQYAISILNANGLGEVSDAYREANADMIAFNKANADLIDAQSKLGGLMQPFSTMLKQSSADILYSFIDLIEGVDGAGDDLLYNIGYLAGSIYKNVRDLISKLLPVVSSFIPQVITMLTDNLPSLFEKGVEITTNIINGIAENIPMASKQTSELLNGIMMTIARSAPALLNSAINLFSQIVIAVAQILVDLSAELPMIIQTIMDGLVNGENSIFDTALNALMNIVDAIPVMLTELIDNLPAIVATIMDALTKAVPKVLDGAINLFNKIVDAIPTVITALGDNMPQVITTIINAMVYAIPQVLNGAIKLFMSILKAIPKIVSALKEAMPKIIRATVDGLVNGAKSLFNVGVEMIKGLIDGLMSINIVDIMKGLGDKALSALKETLGIHSPSKEMAEQVGKPMAQGVAVGIEKTMNEITGTAETLSDSFADGFMAGLNGKKQQISKSIHDTISQASVTATETVTQAGEEMGDTLIKSMNESAKKVENVASIANTVSDIFSVLKDGSYKDIGDNIASIAQNFGPWGMLASAIWGFVSENIIDKADDEIEKNAQTIINKLHNFLMKTINDSQQVTRGIIIFFKTIVQGMIDGTPELLKAIPRVIGEVVETLIGDGIPTLFEVGMQLIEGLGEGLVAGVESIGSLIESVGNGIVKGFKRVFSIFSPSRVMADEIGKNLALGMAVGVQENIGSVNEAVRDGVDTSLELDGLQRKQVNVYQTNNYSQTHSRYELYRSKHDTASAVRLALRG